MFRPPTERVSERLLLYGTSGAGKSNAGLSIATRLAHTGSTAKMYVIDSDYLESWDRQLDLLGDPGNVTVLRAWDWDSWVDALGKIIANVQAGDWIVVDTMSVLWEWAQDKYLHEIYGVDNSADWFIEQKKTMKKGAGTGAALSGMGEWPYIKKLYRSQANRLLLRPGVHILCTAPQERIYEDTADKDVRDTFGHLGGKPGGEKSLPHSLHTVLQMRHNPKAEEGKRWTFTTAKDRGRPYVQQKPVTDFSISYLVAVAGWKLRP